MFGEVTGKILRMETISNMKNDKTKFSKQFKNSINNIDNHIKFLTGIKLNTCQPLLNQIETLKTIIKKYDNLKEKNK